MNGKTAMIPGSFDPPTNGHIDIIKRTCKLYEKVFVVVAKNSAKNPLFTQEERVNLFKQILKESDNIEIVAWDGLLIDFANKYNVDVIVKGVRSSKDFNYEFEMAQVNKKLNPNLETLFLPSDINNFAISSSFVKEISSYGADVSDMVPDIVNKALRSVKKAQSC